MTPAAARAFDAPSENDANLAPAILDALPSHVCVLDAQGTVLWVNQAWREFSLGNGGRAEFTCEGSNYLRACGPAEQLADGPALPMPEQEALCGFTGALREVLAGSRRRADVEYPCHSPQEQRWFVVEATTMNGPGAARAVVAHHPITLHRLADMRQREELRLQALGTLASGIAHDFNNLLSVIHGRSRMLAEDLGAANPAAATHLESVRAAASRATSLVAKILAFGRGEAGELQAQDLVPIVRDAVELFRAGLPAGIVLTVQIEPGPLAAVVDATELTQIVLNLCRNAADALPLAHGEVTVRLRAVPAGPRAGSAGGTAGAQGEAAELVELAVADNGVGIDERTRERIFEPFYSTKPRGQGTGLGLAIVHGIVNRLGGHIEVHSRLKQGSRFEVRLPRADAAALLPPLQLPPSLPLRPQPQQGAGAGASAASNAGAAPRPLLAPGAAARSKHVLLVDDDEVVGLALEAYLQRAGYVPHRHTGPPGALQELHSGSPPFDLVLTDHAMPGMTGVELAQQIARESPALPTVLMSGYLDDGLQAEAMAAGVRAVLRKERIYDDLLPLLDRLLAPAG
jgi:signal transduction histidine kinase